MSVSIYLSSLGIKDFQDVRCDADNQDDDKTSSMAKRF